MDRLQLVIGITIGVLLGSPGAEAAYTVPAVNLPAQTPDIVRDRVARSLASTRDRVGKVLHPFHGEFHGLGVAASGYSYATDLSGDGRVVVGYDLSTTGRRAFAWSPATGKTLYNMLPSDASGTPLPTAVSADGVYFGGSATSEYYSESYYYHNGPHASSGFLFSLAGAQSLPTTYGRDLHVKALSGDGKVIVGVQHRQFDEVVASAFGTDPNYAGNLLDDVSVRSPSQWAYRYTRSGVRQELGILTNDAGYYVDSAAVDVSRDGKIVLVNGSNHSEDSRREPFLWASDGGIKGLGQFDPYGGTQPYFRPLRTTAFAISADGSTVVGATGDYYSDNHFGTYNTPVLWREESGWIDLGELQSTSDGSFLGATATHVSGNGSSVVGWAAIQTYFISGDGAIYLGGVKSTPFLWDEARGMRELAAVLQLDYGLDLSGWTLNEAAGISDDGTTIIGNGLNPSGQNEAWRTVLARTTPLGDIDFDGDIDPQDYAQLTSNLGAASDTRAVFYADGDLNADGRVDQSDAATLQGLYQGRKQGDFNADGVVNMADYTVWRDNLGRFTGGLADSNGDGWVNQTDLATWRTHFGSAISAFLPLSVPEPNAATLLAAAALAAVSRRR